MKRRLKKKLVNQVIHNKITKAHKNHVSLCYRYKGCSFAYTITKEGIVTSGVRFIY